MHPISVNTERAEQARKEYFYTFQSLDAFSRLESGDNRKKVGKVGPSKIYLQEIKVYLMKIKVIIGFFLTKYRCYRFYIIFYKIIGF